MSSIKRAHPLPPAERREAIVTAVLPLLVERGTAVTSRELARAAGVAEGTIFKAFRDKDDLYAAVMARAIDPEPIERSIEDLDPDIPFEERLVSAARFMQRRLLDVWSLFGVVGASVIPPEQRRMPDSAALTALFVAESALVRIRPEVAARQFRALVLALSHPILNDPPPSADEIVAMFLHGVATHP